MKKLGMLAFATRKQRNRHGRSRKLRGGKYVGQGTYGCGFAPALRCKGETVRKPGLFTKLMLNDPAIDEYYKVDMIKPIDPTMKYILYPIKLCDVNVSLIGPGNPEDDVQSCDLADFPKDLSKAKAIQYIDGGADLEKFEVKAYKVLPVFFSLQNLIVGIFKIHKAGLSHNDIKPGNVVLKENEGKTFTARYIDIGFVHRMNKGVRHYDDLPFEADYYPWPFDMRFSTRYSGPVLKSDIQKWMDAYEHSFLDYIPYELLRNEDGSAKLTPDGAQKIYDAMNILASSQVNPLDINKSSREIKNEIFEKRSELTLQKVDTYSLGVVFLYMYRHMLNHRVYKGKVEFFIARTSAYHDVSTLESQGIPEATRKWHEAVAIKVTKPYVKLCLKMMHLNPFKRPTFKTILERYQKLLLKMKPYFTEDQIEQHVMLWK